MGVRPTRYVLSGLAVLAAAGPAQAVVKTQVVASGATSAIAPYALPLFDPHAGTLLKVAVQADYSGSVGFYYAGLSGPIGYDHAISGAASLGSLSFDLAGTTQTVDYGAGRGVFTVSALGTGSWTNAADLARFTAGGAGQISTSLLAPAPGTPMAGGSGPSVSYKVTYTYDDGMPAVPEPATWAMMAGGFILVGVALRSARQRRRGASSGAPTAA